MTILEKIKFEEDWLSEVNLTKENIKIAFAGIRATALEQETCENCISRQSAIDTIERWLSCDDYNEAERHIMRAMQSVLYDLPSVTPKGVTITDFADRCRECGREKVLDKIRAEIETMSGDIETIADALNIIDKYRLESEDAK